MCYTVSGSVCKVPLCLLRYGSRLLNPPFRLNLKVFFHCFYPDVCYKKYRNMSSFSNSEGVGI